LLDVLVPIDPPPPPPPPPPPEVAIPKVGTKKVSPNQAAELIAQIQQAHPTAEIEVSIRWKSRGT